MGCVGVVYGEWNQPNAQESVQQTPIDDHPAGAAFAQRFNSESNCTNDELKEIEGKCMEVVSFLVDIVDEYENGLRNYNANIPSLSRCERAQIACFVHPIWILAAECACSVCNHIWFYDEAMHERFVLYFTKDHQCDGKIPNRMWKMQFCHFMALPERKILPNKCNQTMATQEERTNIIFNDEKSASNVFGTNYAIMIWTTFIALSMSISMYLWLR